MDAALRLGLRHTLHAVHARFVFERPIDILAGDLHDDLLVTARGAVGKRRDFITPPFRFDVFGIHAQQVAGEYGSLVAARTASNLDDGILRILRVFGNQQQLNFLFEPPDFGLQLGNHLTRHLTHFLVLIVHERVFRLGEVGECRTVTLRRFDDGFELLELFRQLNELFDICNDFGVGQFLTGLLVLEFQPVQTGQYGIIRHV